ncbi:MAG TPA: LPXTG cell wall anchor domain-containing protein [Bryobacteraceae bacterium]|nr:LPXTG cell wall anchor domain-containing protein [Bryobacteraceae bacterium]
MEEFKRMNVVKALAVVSGLGMLSAMFAVAPNAKADQWNKKTILTINEPIQVPNKLLEPGKYVMKLMDSPSNRHIVQIFNSDESHLVTTILALPNYRLEPTGKTQFSFWETPPGQPKALRAWFYPGDNFGQEFAYPKTESTAIAQYTHTPVPTTAATSEAEMKTAPVEATNEQGQQTPLDTNTYKEEQPQVAQNTPPAAEPTPAPEAAPAPAPAQLPKTGSPLPLVGLIGLLSLGGYFTLRAIRES